MSISEGAPAWLIALLLFLLAIAAVEDGVRLRISNLVVIAIAAAGVTAMSLAAIGWDAWQPLLLAAAILAVGTPLFAAGWLGGGDVKLLAASATWFTLDGGWKMLVAVAVAGGILTLILIAVRMVGIPDRWRQRIALFRRGVGVPYGIAVAAGVTVTILADRPLLP